MSLHHLSEETRVELRRQLMRFMATHSGIDGLMELLSNICSDFGGGTAGGGKPIDPDPCWLAIAAAVDDCKDRVIEILEEYE